MARYEYSQGSSSKFWEIALDGTSVVTRWGKIGSKGQETTKSFETEREAKKEHDRLVAEKTKKGYVAAGETKIRGDAPADEVLQPKPRGQSRLAVIPSAAIELRSAGPARGTRRLRSASESRRWASSGCS